MKPPIIFPYLWWRTQHRRLVSYFCFVLIACLRLGIRSTLWERTEWTRAESFGRECHAWWKTCFRQILTFWCNVPTDDTPSARWVVPLVHVESDPRLPNITFTVLWCRTTAVAKAKVKTICKQLLVYVFGPCACFRYNIIVLPRLEID